MSERFGRRLALLRRGITLAELGDRIRKSPATICGWERGDRIDGRLGDVGACARALGCRFKNLIGPADDPTRRVRLPIW